MSSKAPSETLIARDTVIEGDVEASEDLRVFGAIEGSASVDGLLIIESSGVLFADAEAHEIHVAGVVKGKLRAAGLIVLAETARVIGDVHCPRIAMAPGAALAGQLTTVDKEGSARRPASARKGAVFVGDELEAVDPPSPRRGPDIDAPTPPLAESHHDAPAAMDRAEPASSRRKKRVVLKVKRRKTDGLGAN